MNTIKFPQANRVLTAPPGMEDRCGDLHTYSDSNQCISCWQPTPAEVEALSRGAPVWLYVVYGGTQPPVAVTVENPFDPAALSRDLRALRNETFIEELGTIVQAGHRDRKTSHEVALEIDAYFARYLAAQMRKEAV